MPKYSKAFNDSRMDKASNSVIRNREIFMGNKTISFTKYGDLLRQVVDTYRANGIQFSDAVEGMMGITLENVGQNKNLCENLHLSNHILEDLRVKNIQQCKTGTIEVVNNDYNQDNNLLASQYEAKIIAYNALMTDFKNKYSPDATGKQSISCEDITDLKRIASIFKPSDLGILSKENVNMQRISRACLLNYALANSLSTLTGAMNEMIHLMEDCLSNFSAEDLMSDKIALEAYMLTLRNYINLCAEGSVSVSSLNKSIIVKSTSIVASCFSKQENILKMYENGEECNSTFIVGSMLKPLAVLNIKSKQGLKSASLVLESFKQIFDAASKTIENSSNNDIKSQTCGIVAIGNIVTASQKAEYLYKNQTNKLRVADDRLDELSGMFSDMMGQMLESASVRANIYSNAIHQNGKLDELLNINAGESENSINHQRDVHLLEAKYESLMNNIDQNIDKNIRNNQMATVYEAIKQCAIIRQYICECDSPSSKREIYGFNDQILDKLARSLILSLKINKFNLEQSKYAVDCIAEVIRITYAKYRSKPSMQDFIAEDLQAKSIMELLRSNMNSFGQTSRVALNYFDFTLFSALSDFNHADTSANYDSFVLSSPVLRAINIMNRCYSINVDLLSGNTDQAIENVSMLNTLMLKIHGVLSYPNLIGSFVKTINKAGLSMSTVAKDPVKLTNKILVLISSLNAAAGNPSNIVARQLQYTTFLKEGLLNTLFELKDSLSDPSSSIYNSMAVQNKIKDLLTVILNQSFNFEKVKGMGHMEQSNLYALSYVAAIMGNNHIAANAARSAYQKMEHQSSHTCRSLKELTELGTALKSVLLSVSKL